MPDDVKLRECPFCGGEANADGHARYNKPLPDTHWEDGSEITEAFFVNCVKCGVDNGRPGLVAGYQTKDEAITAWNTRPDPSEEDVERVQEELERQMEWDQNDLPTSLQMEAGLVWLEGWFNLRAAINALKGERE